MLLARLGAFVICSASLFAQTDPVVQAARRYRQAHEREIISSYMELLAIPNVTADPADLRRNADVIAHMLQKRGVATKLLEYEGAPPVVFGELRTPGATRTLLFYAHYDGSPLSPKDWLTPPFQPALRSGAVERDGQVIPLPEAGKPFNPEWRIYARSASDDKAPIIALLTALDAFQATRQSRTVNVKFVFEGEEEAGSTHLEQIITSHKGLLKSDVWLICDGPVHQSRAAQIVFGARGVVTATLTVYGARGELHSGHYGNWAPNPALMLAHLLASIKDENGKVLIEHFYDGLEPLSHLEREALTEAAGFDDQLKRELWLGWTEGRGRPLAELINLPSFNIRGLSSGRTEQASNVIPASATAAIDMRLVKGITHEQAIARLKSHLEKQGYFLVDHVPDASIRREHPRVLYFQTDEFGYDAVRTPMDLPIAQAVLQTAARAKTPIVKLPTMGGSLPLIMIERPLGVHTIVVPIANHDNNQHSSNENIRLQNLWDGIDLMAAMLTMQ